MGLYDTFVAPTNTICPHCGESLKQFQTKGLGESMGMFRIGDEVADLERDLYIERGWVHCYSSCDKCRWWIDAHAIIENAKYVGFEITESRPPVNPAPGTR